MRVSSAPRWKYCNTIQFKTKDESWMHEQVTDSRSIIGHHRDRHRAKQRQYLRRFDVHAAIIQAFSLVEMRLCLLESPRPQTIAVVLNLLLVRLQNTLQRRQTIDKQKQNKKILQKLVAGHLICMV
eukprot:TRINITY_DN8334_c0_g1_i5.p1 TRINITY_DN8334_c0_g1~~TRINITY_DN8334_c0_g1_i5.p1  ORF type:complete len:126 (-),score=14.73 TRINITY_DN8334_c0_g1_i5:106-483(-)